MLLGSCILILGWLAREPSTVTQAEIVGRWALTQASAEEVIKRLGPRSSLPVVLLREDRTFEVENAISLADFPYATGIFGERHGTWDVKGHQLYISATKGASGSVEIVQLGEGALVLQAKLGGTLLQLAQLPPN